MLNLKELFHNQNVRKFVSLLSTDVLVRGANFLLIPIFLYLMPMEEFGVYGYLYNFAITCSLIMKLGYHSALPKMYSATKENKVDNSSMLFTLSTTLFGFVASLFLIFYLIKTDILLYIKLFFRIFLPFFRERKKKDAPERRKKNRGRTERHAENTLA